MKKSKHTLVTARKLTMALAALGTAERREALALIAGVDAEWVNGMFDGIWEICVGQGPKAQWMGIKGGRVYFRPLTPSNGQVGRTTDGLLVNHLTASSSDLASVR